ncbi:MAG TPA: hypothetical protein IAD39_02575 [Candidatus Merdisoma faecalis]|nr:hypothetical protein [Candidatus Merdisoma faecalis]
MELYRRSTETIAWRRKLRGFLWTGRLFCPLFLVVYVTAWGAFVRLCLYGGVRRNLPLLALCMAFFAVYLIVYLVELCMYGKRSLKRIFSQFEIEENRIAAEWEEDDRKQQAVFELRDVRWYRKKKEHIFLFLKGHRFVWLDTEQISEQKREFLEMKLTQRGILATHFWRIPIALILAGVTFLGAAGTAWSAVPFNGKLSWVINELQSSRRVRLVHNNIYEDGLDGILEDIRGKVDLPEKLCLVNSFNLHFRADGTVETLYTFVKGFDENGNFVDSYLISYDAADSDKITIWLGGAADMEFDQEKDLEPLLEAMRVLPLKETVENWQEDIYGILYYGERSWGYSTEGIRYLEPDGSVSYPGAYASAEIKGFSVSVFCPENEAVTPVRYLYRGIL